MIAGPPKPVGPFGHAVEVYGTVFVTGQMPDVAEMPGLLPDGIEAQTQCHVKSDDRLVWSEPWSGEHRNGAHLANAVSGRQYRTEYGLPELFSEGRLPARTCVGVTGLLTTPLSRSIFREAYARKMARLVAGIFAILDGDAPDRERRPWSIVVMMVGTIFISRAMPGSAASEADLDSALATAKMLIES